MASLPTWTAAQAKLHLSEVLDSAQTKPQMILRHGRPAGVVINFALYEARSASLQPSLESWVSELSDINQREGEFEPLPRADRTGIASQF